MSNGKWIVVEGIDGSGSTTLVSGLAAKLFQHSKSWHVVATREPSDGVHGQRIRRILMKQEEAPSADEFSNLFIEDRYEHMQRVVVPNLVAGAVVVQDRGMYSTICYQGQQGVDISRILKAHERMPLIPDLVLVLNVSADVAAKRMAKDRGEKEYFDLPDFQKGLIPRYAALHKVVSNHPIKYLNGNLSVEQVLSAAWSNVLTILPKYN